MTTNLFYAVHGVGIRCLRFGLQGTDLFGVVIMVALPTVQNVLLFSQQFSLEATVVRDVALCNLLLALPVALVITLFLG